LAGVVLDVDGTLVDSERDGHLVAFNQAFEEAGLSYRWSPRQYGELLAVTGGRLRLRRFLEGEGLPGPECEDLAARLHGRKTEVFQELVADGRVPPRPGVVELLDELGDAGVPMAIATTGSRAWVEPLLARLFGLHRFAVVVTGDDTAARKPDPEAHRRAAKGLEVGGRGVVVAVEDSRNGLEAALAAGLPCAVVVNDYTRDQDLTGAALVLDGFGRPGHPAAVLHDPSGLAPERLDLATLRALAG
jgi:HAD superfamily hydrolase (TIGR01509 family)